MQGFRPDVDRLVARGFDVVQSPDGLFDQALVHIGKSRAGNFGHIATALAHLGPGGMLMIDGQKDLGVETILKQMRQRFDIKGVLSKAHGKLIWLRRPDILPDNVADWALAPVQTPSGYKTAPDGFSAAGPDRGSEILVALCPAPKGCVADFGAGWGYIAAEILAENPDITHLDLYEAHHGMLDLARQNIPDARAGFYWADITHLQTDERYDMILCNPPFHTGRQADPDLGRAFIAAAARNLKSGGRFIMVANRHLPYEDSLKMHFATGRLLGELDGYKLYEAAKPRPLHNR